jgi:hypothetical protein
VDTLYVLLVALSGVGLGAKAVHSAYFCANARLRRALARTRPTPIAAAVDGLVHVRGMVVHRGTPLRGPLSERPCVAFEVWVEQRADEDKRWRRIYHACQYQPFGIIDPTGEAAVEPGEGDHLLVQGSSKLMGGTRSRDGSETEHIGRVRKLVRQAGVSLESPPLAGDEGYLRYYEGVIEPGTEVSVLGAAIRRVHAEAYRPEPRALALTLVLCGTPDQPLGISNEPLPS